MLTLVEVDGDAVTLGEDDDEVDDAAVEDPLDPGLAGGEAFELLEDDDGPDGEVLDPFEEVDELDVLLNVDEVDVDVEDVGGGGGGGGVGVGVDEELEGGIEEEDGGGVLESLGDVSDAGVDAGDAAEPGEEEVRLV